MGSAISAAQACQFALCIITAVLVVVMLFMPSGDE